MITTIQLSMPARVFEAVDGKQLARMGRILEKGSSLTIIQKAMMIYDHRDQLAVSFLDQGETCWILAVEAGIALH